MPSLTQVFERFPDSTLVLDLKGNTLNAGQPLAAIPEGLPDARQEQLMVYGGQTPVRTIQDRLPKIKTIWPKRLKHCLGKSIALGCSGCVPAECRKSMHLISINIAPCLWGWPNRFLQRVSKQGSQVFVARIMERPISQQPTQQHRRTTQTNSPDE